MSSSAPAIIPPGSLGEAVRSIGLLSEVEFTNLFALITGPRGFKPAKDEFESLERSSPNFAGSLGFLLAALSYLTGQAERFEETGQSFDSIFPSLVDDLDKEANWENAKDVASKRLKKIFDNRDAYKGFKKLARLRSGFLPNATSFSTFVDVRPNFDGNPKRVVDLLPMVQVRIATDSTIDSQREIVFQLSEDAIKLLKEAISSVEEKVEILKAANYFTVKN